MGPGPINADPRVLRAMSAPLVGQFDPVMTGYMNETMALYRAVFAHRQRGDVAGRRHVPRGHRGGAGVAGPARRPGAGAGVRPVRAPARRDRRARAGRGAHDRGAVGAGVPTSDRSRTAIAPRAARACSPIVQGDTSTTMRQPLDEPRRDLPRARRAALHRRDRVRSAATRSRWTPGASTPRPPGCRSAWRGPSGSAPVSLSAARRRGDPRRASSRGRDPRRADDGAHRRARSRSNYFDLAHDPRLLGPAPPQPPHRGHVACCTRRASAPGSWSTRASTPPSTGTRRHGARDARRGAGAGPGGVRRRGPQDAQRGRGRDPGRRRRRRRARRAAAATSASRSARRSARCTAGSGASAPWAPTRASTPC